MSLHLWSIYQDTFFLSRCAPLPSLASLDELWRSDQQPQDAAIDDTNISWDSIPHIFTTFHGPVFLPHGDAVITCQSGVSGGAKVRLKICWTRTRDLRCCHQPLTVYTRFIGAWLIKMNNGRCSHFSWPEVSRKNRKNMGFHWVVTRFSCSVAYQPFRQHHPSGANPMSAWASPHSTLQRWLHNSEDSEDSALERQPTFLALQPLRTDQYSATLMY